jgi:hypothetical protein
MKTKGNVAAKVKELLDLGYQNGHKDATGVMAKVGNSWITSKSEGSPAKLFKTNRNLMRRLELSQFAIGHNRYTTSGKASFNANNHPFSMGDFVMVHNGVLDFNVDGEYVYEDMQDFVKVNPKIETDSYKFMCIFYYYFNKLTSLKDRQHAVVTALENALTHTGGNFSIFLVDRLKDVTYYFKEEDKQFHFKAYINSDTDWELYGSTTYYNLDYLKYYGDTKGVFTKASDGVIYEFMPTDKTIYKIDVNEKDINKVITELGTFTYYKRPMVNKGSLVNGHWVNKYTKIDEGTFLAWYPDVMQALELLDIPFDELEWDDENPGDISFYHREEEHSDKMKKVAKHLETARCRVTQPYSGIVTLFLYDYADMVEYVEDYAEVDGSLCDADEVFGGDDDDSKMASYLKAKEDADIKLGLESLF